MIEMLENNGEEGGRRAKPELDLLLQIINNIKAAGYCPAVARLPDKAKDLGCLFKIVFCLFKLVTCLFEIVNIWSSVLCSHIMTLF